MHEKHGYKGGGSKASTSRPVKLDQSAAQSACSKNAYQAGKDAAFSRQGTRTGGYKPK